MINSIIYLKQSINSLLAIHISNKFGINYEEFVNFINNFEIKENEYTSSQNQTKEWRKSQKWYINGKLNECEKEQIKLIKEITLEKGKKTNVRLNFETLKLIKIKNPNKEINGYEFTENFDLIIKNIKNKYYFNLKFCCDQGGAQTRSLREVYHFIECQILNLNKFKSEDIYFVNILDGDSSYSQIDKFKYLIEKYKKEDSFFNSYLYVGDMKQFEIWWKN